MSNCHHMEIWRYMFVECNKIIVCLEGNSYFQPPIFVLFQGFHIDFYRLARLSELSVLWLFNVHIIPTIIYIYYILYDIFEAFVHRSLYITPYKIPCHSVSTFLNFSFIASGRHLAEVPRGGSSGRRTRPPPKKKLEKNMIFWRKIVIFHTKYRNNFRVFLRSVECF